MGKCVESGEDVQATERDRVNVNVPTMDGRVVTYQVDRTRVPYVDHSDDAPPLSPLALLEVYQRALYEALTRVNDDTPEWAHLIHAHGVAVVMDVDSFLPDGGHIGREQHSDV